MIQDIIITGIIAEIGGLVEEDDSDDGEGTSASEHGLLLKSWVW